MSESTTAVTILVAAVLLLLVLAFWGSRFLLRRAIIAIIKKFRENNAFDSSTAKTQEELGLKSKGLLEIRGLRDYKPMALQLLIRNDIIQITQDERLFLSEDVLSRTNLEQKRGIN